MLNLSFATSEESRTKAYENGRCRDCGEVIQQGSLSSRCSSCEEDFSAYKDSLWGLDHVVKDRFEEPPEPREKSNHHEPDPYKSTWNSLKEEEIELQRRTRNGCLFVPSHAELARRSMATARDLLRRARKLGRTTEGIAIFEEALIHRTIARGQLEAHDTILRHSR